MTTNNTSTMFISRLKKGNDAFSTLFTNIVFKALLGVRMKLVSNRIHLSDEGKAEIVAFCNLKEVKGHTVTCTECKGSGVWRSEDRTRMGNCAACIIGTTIMADDGQMTLLDRIGHAEYLADKAEKEARKNRFDDAKPTTDSYPSNEELQSGLEKPVKTDGITF